MRPTSYVCLLALAAAAAAEVITKTEPEAAVMFAAGEYDVVVDTRGTSAYEKSHVQGAVLKSKTNLDGCEQKRVAFYCSAGSASEAAANQYASSGGENAYAIGTIDGLREAGVPMESGMPESHSSSCAVAKAAQEEEGDFGATGWIIFGVVGAVAALGLAAWCLVSTLARWRRDAAAASPAGKSVGGKQIDAEMPPTPPTKVPAA